MYSKEVVIRNQSGLHARPASTFVEEATKYSSRIKVKRPDDEEEIANGKSIVTILSLSLAQGDHAVIMANGADEQEAVEALAALIDGGFGEL